MKRKIISVLLTLVLVLSFSLVATVPVAAIDGAVHDRTTAILEAADRLVETQSNDGGFDWVWDDDLTDPSGTNVLGITAIGILKAYELEEKTADQKAAYEGALAKAYGYATLNDARYVYPDVTFLVWLADAAEADASLLDAINTVVSTTTTQDIRTLAQSIWDARMFDGTYGDERADGLNLDAAERAKKDLENRGNALGFWDLGAAVKASLALGLDPDAAAIAGVMDANLVSGSTYYFDIAGASTEECYVLALSGTIEAFLEVGVSSTMARTMTDYLIASQDETGYWDEVAVNWLESVQSTAYAVMALVKQGDDDAVIAARKGADWLVGRQNLDGGWNPAELDWNEECLETDSEAAWALASVSAPVTIGTDDYYSIQSAIDSATEGDTINVAAGIYSENIVVGKQLILEGAQAGEDPTVEGARTVTSEESTIQGSGGTVVTISADGVIISGFTITNPQGLRGVKATDQSDLTIEDNIVTAIGGGGNDVQARGIVIVCSASAVDGVTIQRNEISNITSGKSVWDGSWSSTSAIGIQIGHSTGDEDVTNLLIQDNVISDIDCDYSPWKTDDISGYGAYGIMLSHAAGGAGKLGETVDAQVLDNTISDLEGLWAHGIGLEGNTPGAVISGNAISDLTDHKGSTDAVAIQVESNLSASTVAIGSNEISEVVIGIQNTTALLVTAENNWWGHSRGIATVGSVDVEPWLLVEDGDPYEKTISLPEGWSLVSPDKVLSWASFVDVEILYEYADGFITPPVSDFTPLTAVYAKTLTGGGVGFNYDVDEMPAMLSKNLEAGWNLIGIPDMEEVDVDAILASLRYVTIGTQQGIGLTTLVSQGEYNLSGEDFFKATLTDDDWIDLPELLPLDGYWAHMEAAEVFTVPD